jgi:mannose-6-phosphate isomerase-like protein (cupin superfamily)
MPMRFASAALISLTAVLGSGASAQVRDHVAPASLQWKQIIPGADFAAAYGDWEKGAHGKYVRFVKGVQIPLHRHSNEYHAVFISGRMNNLFEGGKRVAIAPGDYFYMAAGRAHSHECLSNEGCLFYTYGDLLWDFVPYAPPAQGAAASERGQ